MSGRPEVLFPLFADLTSLPGVGERLQKIFAQMGVEKPRDLLFTLPHSGIDRARRATIQGLDTPGVVTVEVEVLEHRRPRRKGGAHVVTVRDAGATFRLVFFHARPDYLERLLPLGARRVVSGRLEFFDGAPQIVHPDHVLDPAEADDLPLFEPVYPLTQGLSQKVMRKAVRAALARAPDLDEWIDESLRAREGWPRWRVALEEAHNPLTAAELAPEWPARQRLAFDEFYAHQLALALARAHLRRGKGVALVGDGRLRRKVLDSLPFPLTGAQRRAIAEIEKDMAAPRRMNRLLQGDVGAGKTLVAFMALLIAVEAGRQGVLMAPTEVLARQHYAGLGPLAAAAGVRLEILTGRDKGAERRAKLDALRTGEVDILVGTHAVFQDDVTFKALGLAVIDEQHRFGVAQRMRLSGKGPAVDVLVMTATPIPRSLALAHYGDMDVSVLDEKPPGRTPVATALVPTTRMDDVIERLRHAIAEGRQAYWVCPLVEESEAVDLASAEERYKALSAALGDGVVGLVHGQMPPAEKDAAMARFAAGETRVLVATTVIEVGVDVPNASIMVVERAEIFGLAQLHQLRGRVGRGAQKSTCLLMYKPPLSETARRRLTILRETDDGFRIAEEDLAMRGAGDLIGTVQSGLPRFRIGNIEHQTALMALAQNAARKLLHDDPGLQSPAGQAARVLLWLMEEDKSIRLIAVG
ncbi:MAG: ATP-dependent DNA helicase RecG [Alphaproteobacteria bacterium]|nr:MAG: ATP-dependent DNA helicase RecG [Alphaproteobacteria bacterium]